MSVELTNLDLIQKQAMNDLIIEKFEIIRKKNFLIYDLYYSLNRENSIMSCNLGIFASVCLASRLHQHEDVFALINTAVALFALFPSFRKHCKVRILINYVLSFYEK